MGWVGSIILWVGLGKLLGNGLHLPGLVVPICSFEIQFLVRLIYDAASNNEAKVRCQQLLGIRGNEWQLPALLKGRIAFEKDVYGLYGPAEDREEEIRRLRQLIISPVMKISMGCDKRKGRTCCLHALVW